SPARPCHDSNCRGLRPRSVWPEWRGWSPPRRAWFYAKLISLITLSLNLGRNDSGMRDGVNVTPPRLRRTEPMDQAGLPTTAGNGVKSRNGEVKKGSKVVKNAGKAAAAAMGKRLMTEFEEIRKASKKKA